MVFEMLKVYNTMYIHSFITRGETIEYGSMARFENHIIYCLLQYCNIVYSYIMTQFVICV